MPFETKFDPKKEYFTDSKIPKADVGVVIKELLGLISGSPYESILYNEMGIEEMQNDLISIPGASFLARNILEAHRKYLKYDIICEYQDIKFKGIDGVDNIEMTMSNIRRFYFSDMNRADEIDINDEQQIIARPVYSVKSDFFSNFYNMGRYATSLLDEGKGEVVARNMKMIQDIYREDNKKFDKKYRVLRNEHNDDYLRAIISTTGYKDYHIGISVFVALIALHKDMLANKSKYRIVYFEYNESSVRVFFEKEGEVKIEGFGTIKYGIELFNDETKKSSLNMSGVYAVVFREDGNQRNMYMDNKSKSDYSILSITHRVSPETLASRLEITEDIAEVEKDILDDISSISKVKKPDQLRYYFKRKIEESRNKELDKYRNRINSVLTNKINTVYGLLSLMNKVDEIVEDEDLEAKEFLRYLMHDIVTKRKPKRKPKKDDTTDNE